MNTFTVSELAQRWRKAEKTIRRWIASGYLKPRKVGRSYLFTLSEVERAERLMDVGEFL
mgnify:CR=1 FL=1|tara:strand:+ start:531 stop:707 length:177 start_codon:yes stop_codon:yes gene_type:complete